MKKRTLRTFERIMNNNSIFGRRNNRSMKNNEQEQQEPYVFKEILEEVGPSKEFAQRLSFEVDQIQSSLFATFFNKQNFFNKVKSDIDKYVASCDQKKNGSGLEEYVRKPLLSFKKELETCVSRLQHEDIVPVKESLKEELSKIICSEINAGVQKILLAILSNLCEQRIWAFDVVYIRNLIASISKILESDDSKNLASEIGNLLKSLK